MKNLIGCILSILFISSATAQNGLEFDGTNDYVQTTYPGVSGASSRTFEAWINVDAGLSSNNSIMDYGLNAVGSRNTFAVTANYQLIFISGGTNANISSGNNVINPNQWTHVAFVLNNGTGFLYVNGAQVGTGSLTSVNTPSGNTNLRIGQRVSGGSIPFHGTIDEVRMWNIARSASQIANSRNAEFCTIPSSLKAYYQFNQGNASGTNTGITSLVDNSGNGGNGTLNGFALSGASSNWVTGASLIQGGSMGPVVNVSFCSPYGTFGGQLLYTSGTYQDTVTLPSGCDSIYTINYTALPPNFGSITTTTCDSFIGPSGNIFRASGTFNDTLQFGASCDSVYTINLTINNSSSDTIQVDTCGTYTSPAGNTYDSTGIYTETYQNGIGCDSLFVIDLTILSASSSTITDSACGSYTSAMGIVYNGSGTFTEVAVGSNGCDSIITLNLTIKNLNSTVTSSGNTLSAAASGLTYQWLDCDLGNSSIAGATAQTYSPSTSGTFAVQVSDGFCTDTSNCTVITIVGIEDNPSSKHFQLSPNPASDVLLVSSDQEILAVRLFDQLGKVVMNQSNFGTKSCKLKVQKLKSGIYIVSITTADGNYSQQVLVD